MKATISFVLVFLAVVQLALVNAGAKGDVPASCLNKKFDVDPFECCKTPKLLGENVIKDCVKAFPPPQNPQDEIKPDVSQLTITKLGNRNRHAYLFHPLSSACRSA